MTKLKDVIPILDVRDVNAALRFYVERLGFKIDFRDEDHPDNYAGIRRDCVHRQMQWQHEDAFKDGTAGRLRVRIAVDDHNELFEEYKDAGILNPENQIRDTAWGTREFSVRDLDGNGLIFFREP